MQIRFYLMVGPGYTGLDPDQATRIQNFDLSIISDTACPKSHAHLYIATHVIKGTILFGYTVYRDDTLKRRYIYKECTITLFVLKVPRSQILQRRAAAAIFNSVN